MTATKRHQEKYGFIRDRLACGMFHLSCVFDDGTVKVYGSDEGQEPEVAEWRDIVKVACGPFRTLGLKKDGTVVCTTGEKWSNGVNAANGVENFSDAIDISCGSFHNVALRRDGKVHACGSNEDGQCNVESWTNVKKVCAENNHTIALTNDGELLYCGKNDGGSLNLKGMSGVKDIYCGINDTIIVKEDGTVYAAEFGNECPRKLDVAADEVVAVSFSVEYYAILKTDGTLFVGGNPPFEKSVTEGWTGILDVDCMKKGCSCLLSDGGINSVDPNNKIEFKNRAISVNADDGGVCALVDVGGNVIAFGKYIPDDVDIKLFDYIPGEGGENLDRVSEIVEKVDYPHKKGIAWDHLQKFGYLNDHLAGGLGHTAAILHNGEIYACGANRQGQCDIEHWSDIKQIVCTAMATVGLKKNGQVVFAGDLAPFEGTVMSGTPLSRWPDNIVSLSASVGHGDHILGLSADGKVFACGSNSNGQCAVSGWCDIIEAKAAFGYSAGVRKDGTVVVCGNDTIKSVAEGWENIEHIYCSVEYMLGLQYDGRVVCAGKTNYFGPDDFADWRDIIDISYSINAVAGITGEGKARFVGKLPAELLQNGLNDVLFADIGNGMLMAGCTDGNTYIGNSDSVSKSNSLAVFSKAGFLTKMFVDEGGWLFVIVQDESVQFGQDDCSSKWQLFISEEERKMQESQTVQQTQQQQPQSSSSTGCYVATCVYGSYDCPEVWTLRRFRDNTLASTMLGRAFIRTYYAVSPTLVKWFGECNWFKSFFGNILDKWVAKLNSEGVENTPYEDRDWN